MPSQKALMFLNTDSKDVAVPSWGPRDASACPGAVIGHRAP